MLQRALGDAATRAPAVAISSEWTASFCPRIQPQRPVQGTAVSFIHGIAPCSAITFTRGSMRVLPKASERSISGYPPIRRPGDQGFLGARPRSDVRQVLEGADGCRERGEEAQGGQTSGGGWATTFGRSSPDHKLTRDSAVRKSSFTCDYLPVHNHIGEFEPISTPPGLADSEASSAACLLL